MTRPRIQFAGPLALVILAAVIGLQWWHGQAAHLPAGIAAGNGRIEAERVDIAPRGPGRVKEVLVREGDRVAAGQVLARMDQVELEASLAKAKADLAQAEADVGQAAAAVLERESSLKLAQEDLKRAGPLVAGGSLPQRTADVRQSAQEVASANLEAARDNQQAQRRRVQAARAEVARVRAEIEDGILTSPVQGRVLYRLAQPGEVLPAGGKVLTVLDLGQVYMEVFLPEVQAGRVNLGAEARILLDAAPGSPIPGRVTFVSPEAQFTPKSVETANEREKLMFRVRVEIPHAYVLEHFDQVKTGVRGVAQIRLEAAQAWPALASRP